jgi:hypothetical protein
MARRWAPGITTAQRTTVVLEEREFVFDTDLNRWFIGDGSTTGGVGLLRQDEGAIATVTATGGSVARTLANWFRGYGRDAEQPASLGFFTDKENGVLIHRFRDRIFVGDFNDDDGSTTGSGGQTWIADEGLGDWIPRSATLGVHSQIGGIAVHGAARVSDRYKVGGVQIAPWATATVYAAGAYTARQSRIYRTTLGGTSGVTPPTHSSGDASDGGVTWTFVDFAYGAPIGLQGTVIYDTIPDGNGAWAQHLLAVRKSGAGTVFATEIAVVNKGSNVSSGPYSLFPVGSTIGIWLAAGADGGAVSPATAAITIGKTDTTWNSGLVFDAEGISSGGAAIQLAAITDHQISWVNSSSQQVSVLRSAATAFNERTQIVFGNRKIEYYSVGGVMLTCQSDAPAGTASDEHINLRGQAAGTGHADLSTHGTATNIGLHIYPKGTENVYLGGVAVRPITDDGSALGTSAARWSDLFLAGGAVINFNAGDVTITHASNLLAIAGGEVTFAERAVFNNATAALELSSAQPLMRWTATGSGTNEKTWDSLASGTTLLFRTRTDAFGAGATWLTVTRSGTALSSAVFGTGVSDPVARLQAVPRSTTAALTAIGNAINTTNKFANKLVINTTTGAIVTAVDGTAGGVWQALDGTTAHTPV